MRARLTLAVAWLAAMAMAAPGAPIAEEPAPVPEGSAVEETAVEPPPAAEPAAPSPSPAEPATPVGLVDPPAATVAPAGPSDPPKPAAPSPPANSRPQPDRPIAFAAAPGSVTIEDFSFGPAAVTVGVGESVTWRNSGPSSHTATATDGSFDTGLLSSGESGSATFDEAGSFSYLCTPHPFMKGTVRVVAQTSTGTDAGAGAGTGTGDAGSTDGVGGTAGGSDDSAGLPATGAEPLWLAVTGLGLLLIGASGVRGTRRRARP